MFFILAFFLIDFIGWVCFDIYSHVAGVLWLIFMAILFIARVIYTLKHWKKLKLESEMDLAGWKLAEEKANRKYRCAL